MNRTNTRVIRTISIVIAGLFLLASCAVSQDSESRGNEPIVVGAVNCCAVLDPANTYTYNDWIYLQQIFPSILNVNPATSAIEPEIAEFADFTSPTTFEIRVRSGLEFSNGNELSASDVAHSLNRIKRIESPSGPGSLLQHVNSITLVSPTTLTLELALPNDSTIRKVLSSMAGLVVDEEVFPIDRALENEEVVSGNSFGGPYVLEAFEAGALLSLKPNSSYQGVWGGPKNEGVVVRGYQDVNNLIADYSSGKLDLFLIHRSSLVTQAIELGDREDTRIYEGATMESVSLFLSHRNLPFGIESANPNAEAAKRIRQAIAVLINKEELNDYAYFGTYKPLYAAVPSDIDFSVSDELRAQSKSSQSDRILAAKELLAGVAVELPIEFSMLTTSSRYGDLGLRIATSVQKQLEDSGLFKVSISDVEFQEILDRRREGTFESFLFMWGADFADADNYITLLASTNGRFNTGFSNTDVDELIAKQAQASSSDERANLLGEIQVRLNEHLPFVPLVSGGPTAVARESIRGVETLVNLESKLIFAHLSR